jgi:predicted DNA-binding protein
MKNLLSPTAVRFTPEQLDRIHRESATTGIPRNRIVRLAIDAYFSDRSAA